MLVGLLLILIGIVFAVMGWGGTAKVEIEGLGGLTLVISGVAGIIMIIAGVILLAVPDVVTSSYILQLIHATVIVRNG
jgi:drug/metabolite transporter (DMT)-like permease